MTIRLVCDASAVVALLVDSGSEGQWAAERLGAAELFAPSLLHYETANILRRHELGGAISGDQAAQAHADLLDLGIEVWPYELLGARVWELRHNLSSYDAAYVALAETISARLVTIDKRLSRAPGIRCPVDCP